MSTPRLALVGLPNAGKSTLFQLLTGKAAARESYPFTTLSPASALFSLTDPLLAKLSQIAAAEQMTPAHFLLYDIPGLIKGAAEGAGLGNQFLAEIRPADFLLFVLRNFSTSEITETPDPKSDYELLQTELLLADLQLVERALAKRVKKARLDTSAKQELEDIAATKEALEKGEKPTHLVESVPLLSTKPSAILLNGQAIASSFQEASFSLDTLFFLELTELTEEEQKSFLERESLQSFITSLQEHILNALSLSRFYTATGGKEVRAHLIPSATPCLEAAGQVHNDIKAGFIKALSLPAEKLIALGSWEKARKAGALITQGKEDAVLPDHVIHFVFRAS